MHTHGSGTWLEQGLENCPGLTPRQPVRPPRGCILGKTPAVFLRGVALDLDPNWMRWATPTAYTYDATFPHSPILSRYQAEHSQPSLAIYTSPACFVVRDNGPPSLLFSFSLIRSHSSLLPLGRGTVPLTCPTKSCAFPSLWATACPCLPLQLATT